MIKNIDSLAALMEEAEKAGQGLDEIDINLIRRDSTQPRRTFAEESLQELAESIKAQGVIQPVVLRPDPEQADHYVLIAGERRWRASQIAGSISIPAVVRDASDEAVLAIQLVENLNREDVSVVDEAEAVARLTTMLGKASEVAKALGKSSSWVSQRRKIAKGLYLVQPVVDCGATRDPETLTMLIDLAKKDESRYDQFLHKTRISRGEVRDALDLAKGKPPVAPEKPLASKDSGPEPEVQASVPRNTEPDDRGGESKKVSHVKLSSNETPSGQDEVEHRARLEADLSQRLGQAVTIELSNDGEGELRVHFGTLVELESILDRISGPGERA